MREYAVKLYIDGVTYRLSTDRIAVQENGDSYDYLPLLISVEEPAFGASLDGPPPIPSYRIEAWDATRNVIEDFQSLDYEAVECEVFTLKNGAVLYSFKGYMTDVSNDSVIEFTVRADENYGHHGLVEEFEAESFQYTQMMTPYDADIVLSLKRQSVPWMVTDSGLGRFQGAGGSFSWYPYDAGNISGGISGPITDPSGNGDPGTTYDGAQITYSTNTGFKIGHLLELGLPNTNNGLIKADPDYIRKHISIIEDNYVIENLETGAVARLSGHVWFDDISRDSSITSEVNNVVAIGHEALINPDGSEVTFVNGDSYFIRLAPGLEHGLSGTGGMTVFDNGTPPMVIKSAERLSYIQTTGSGATQYPKRIRVKRRFNRYSYWEYNESDGRFSKEFRTLFDGGPKIDDLSYDETGGYLIIGSPADDIQVVVHYHWMIENGPDNEITFFFDPTEPDLPTFDERVLELIESKPEIRPVYSDGEGGWYTPNDVIFVRHNNFIPMENGERNLEGFISLGQIYEKEIRNSQASENDDTSIKREIHEAYRFKSLLSWEGINIFEKGVLALQIHHQLAILSTDEYNYTTKSLDSHEFVIDMPGVNFTLPWARSLDPGNPITIFTVEWVVAALKFKLDNMEPYEDDILEGLVTQNGGDTYEDPSLRDRLKGRRLDLLMPLSELIDESIANNFNSMEGQELHENILKQANEKFAVCKSSQVRYRPNDPNGGWIDAWEEKVHFDIPTHAGDVLRMLQVDEGITHHSEQNASGARYSNTLTFPTPLADNERWWDSDIPYSDNAAKYFINSMYRVLRDPVPENPKDLGKMFPIVYGYVDRVPMLHVMGTKVMANKDYTAGDDIYVFSSNKVDVDIANDIDIYLGEEWEQDQVDEAGQYVLDIVKSPFPKVSEDDHWIMYTEVRETADGDQYGIRLPVRTTRIPHPYHSLKHLVSREDTRVYGIQLRGHKWEPNLGRNDQRYPIRNGLGNTSLFASFGGEVDHEGRFTDYGSVLTHPLDILRHFIAVHGEYPYSIDKIDEESVERVKSLTRKYEAVAYIDDEDFDAEAMITKVCEQFGFWRTDYNGKIRFSLMDIDRVDYTKAIAPNLNIGNKITEVSQGYGDIFNKIVYKYNKDWIDNGWHHRIKLDEDNNGFCRLASKVKGQLSTKQIDADFVNSSVVARDVVNRITKIQCSKKIIYSFDAKYVEDFELIPGDVVPMTYPPFKMYNEPVFIKSVKPLREKMEIEVVRFPTLHLSEPGAEAFVPSSDYACEPFVDLLTEGPQP